MELVGLPFFVYTFYMDKLKTTTYIAVLIASIMTIFYIGNANQKQFTDECDIAKDMASTYLRQSYDLVDSNNELINRAEGYSAFYSAFCKP
jgi:hypothetical protein